MQKTYAMRRRCHHILSTLNLKESFSVQTYLEYCSDVLDMHQLLLQGNFHLSDFCAETEFADDGFLAFSWDRLSGQKLADLANRSDIRLMLQLLSCSQVNLVVKLLWHQECPHLVSVQCQISSVDVKSTIQLLCKIQTL